MTSLLTKIHQHLLSSLILCVSLFLDKIQGVLQPPPLCLWPPFAWHNFRYPQIMEFVFLGIFTVELILRLIVSGPKKFFSYQNDDFSWYLGGRFF